MKVSELRKALEELDDDMDIIMQKDSEGNGYSPLSGIDTDAIYIPESTYSGTVYSTVWTAEDCCMEDDEWKSMKDDNPRCAVLYPVN